MKFNEWRTLPQDAYQVFENNYYVIWVSGIIMYVNGKYLDIYILAKQAFQEVLNFNDLCGWYRIVIFDKKSDSWIFWGDHLGSQYMFIDCKNARFCDSLLHLKKLCRKDAVQPDLYAVSEMIRYGRVFGSRTICSGLKKTNADCYYFLKNGTITVKRKNLKPFSELSKDYQLNDIFEGMLDNLKGKKICAVCTGGTDSRTILSHLLYHGLKPDLYITGHRDNPDIKIAKALAAELNLPLTIISPDEKEPFWIEKAICFTDGAYDAVLSYRHLQKAQHIGKKYLFEFGGVGGEFYKNDFCHPFRNGIPGKDVSKYVYKNILQNNKISEEWCGRRLIQAADKDIKVLRKIAEESREETKLLTACNRVGYELLRSGSGAITNGYAKTCVKIDPLMDRNLVAAVSQKSFIKLSMHFWQRHEIVSYCPQISAIKTDQGYSCSINHTKIFFEQLKRLYFYSSRVYARVKKKLRLKYKSAEPHYWDRDYRQARQTEEWGQSVNYCKKCGILKQNITDDMIPMEHTGIILLIGVLFSERFNEWIQL